ncbi:MAG: hypothetical protein M3R50_11945, partial [Bacteroidota bacterium]|nr:hypothetical protein [Bacteroidota bacterium]
MERVSTLIDKLQKQLDEKASAQTLLYTVQMLQAELESHAESKKEVIKDKVAVIMPRSFGVFRNITSSFDSLNTFEGKTVEVLQVDEKEIEEELEQIKRNADAVNSMAANVKQPFVYDPIEDVPTLAHQTPLDVPLEKTKIPDTGGFFEYPESLNDRLKQVKIELSEKLTDAPIKDLKKARILVASTSEVYGDPLVHPQNEEYWGNVNPVGPRGVYDEAEWTHFVKTHPDIKFIIAPHEIDKENLDDVKKEFSNSAFYSEWMAIKDTSGSGESKINCIIIDNIGMLSRLYKYATITYVGGGFGYNGLHNILEAAVYGKPVIFGPEYEKNFEAGEMIDCTGAVSIESALELEKVVNNLLDNSQETES